MLFNAVSRDARNAVRRVLVYQKELLQEAGLQKFFNSVSKRLHPSNDNILLHTPTSLTGDPSNICAI